MKEWKKERKKERKKESERERKHLTKRVTPKVWPKVKSLNCRIRRGESKNEDLENARIYYVTHKMVVSYLN